MSLRGFHLLFIGLSAVLAVVVGVWAAGQFQLEHEAGYAVTGAAALAASAGLVVYGARFQRKTRGLVQH